MLLAPGNVRAGLALTGLLTLLILLTHAGTPSLPRRAAGPSGEGTAFVGQLVGFPSAGTRGAAAGPNARFAPGSLRAGGRYGAPPLGRAGLLPTTAASPLTAAPSLPQTYPRARR